MENPLGGDEFNEFIFRSFCQHLATLQQPPQTSTSSNMEWLRSLTKAFCQQVINEGRTRPKSKQRSVCGATELVADLQGAHTQLAAGVALATKTMDEMTAVMDRLRSTQAQIDVMYDELEATSHKIIRHPNTTGSTKDRLISTLKQAKCIPNGIEPHVSA